MAGESYAIPPKDRAVEGILWYIQHHQLASGDRLPAERVLCEVIGVSTETVEADETLADKLGVAVGAPLLRMQRVRLIEGEPASIETAHVNLSLCPSLPNHDFECESLYDVLLKEGGVRVEHGREHISISRLNAEEAELLQQEEGTPVFYESTIEFDKDMRFVEHCKSVILPTKFRFADNGEKNGMRSVAGDQWLRQ